MAIQKKLVITIYSLFSEASSLALLIWLRHFHPDDTCLSEWKCPSQTNYKLFFSNLSESDVNAFRILKTEVFAEFMTNGMNSKFIIEDDFIYEVSVNVFIDWCCLYIILLLYVIFLLKSKDCLMKSFYNSIIIYFR